MFSHRQKTIAILAVLALLIGAEAYIGTLPEPTPSYPPVKEGYGKISIPYPPHHTQNGSRVIIYNKTASAVTEIGNGNGYLNFTVTVLNGYDSQGTAVIHVLLVANCNLPSSPRPTGFEFMGISNSSKSNVDFLRSYNEGKNSSSADCLQTDIDAFNVSGSTFSAESVAEWGSEYEEACTLTLHAVVLGLPKDVEATIEIELEANGTS